MSVTQRLIGMSAGVLVLASCGGEDPGAPTQAPVDASEGIPASGLSNTEGASQPGEPNDPGASVNSSSHETSALVDKESKADSPPAVAVVEKVADVGGVATATKQPTEKADAEAQLVTRPTAFAACAACHSTTPGGKSEMGPSLFGVVGRTSGSLPGYVYSDAMSKAEIKWTPDELDKFIESPQSAIPGTKMFSAGIKDDEKRAEVVRYLSSLKD